MKHLICFFLQTKLTLINPRVTYRGTWLLRTLKWRFQSYKVPQKYNTWLYVHNTYVCMHVCLHTFIYVSSLDKDECYRITSASIIVLGILTCGTSVLLWWIYKRISKCGNSKNKYSLKGIYTYVTYLHK